MPGASSSIRILGSRIHMVDIPGIVSQMKFWIEEPRSGIQCRQIVVTGFHGIWEAFQSPSIKKILNSADLWIPDGDSFAVIARKKGFHSFTKLASSDFIRAFF